MSLLTSNPSSLSNTYRKMTELFRMIFPYFPPPKQGYFVSFVCLFCEFCLFILLVRHNVCLIMELTLFLLTVMSFTIFYIVCAKTPSCFILFDCYTVLHWTDIPV